MPAGCEALRVAAGLRAPRSLPVAAPPLPRDARALGAARSCAWAAAWAAAARAAEAAAGAPCRVSSSGGADASQVKKLKKTFSKIA